ncbi:MAG: alpha-amylase family protein [Armatimonadota bacterium]|nr:alpha-amylase family protein [Armatimonadota bacterium]
MGFNETDITSHVLAVHVRVEDHPSTIPWVAGHHSGERWKVPLAAGPNLDARRTVEEARTMRRCSAVVLVLGTLLAASAGAAEWTYNMAFTQWAGSNDADRYYTNTTQECEQRAAAITAAGYRAVILSGYHFRLNYLDRDEDVRHITRRIVEACHRHGLKVIEHLDLTIVYYDAYPLAWQHLDWLQLHAADMMTRHRIFCFNNPEFRDFYLDYCRRFQRETDIDAWQMDEIAWLGRGFCGCRWCRARWRQEKGRAYPPVQEPGFFDRALADPQYREWMHWRGGCLNDFRRMVRDGLRAIRPDVAMFTYTTAPQSTPYVWNRGGDYASRAETVDTIGTELNPVPFDSYPYIAGLLAQRRALAEATGKAAWAKFDITIPSAYFCWAFGRTCGHSLWWSLRPDNQEPRPEGLLQWPWQMDDASATLDADIGIVLSGSTRDLQYDFDYYHREFEGWLQALLLRPFATRVIIESEMTEPKALDRYTLVVLPNVTAVSPEQKQALMHYVRAGGLLLLTYEAGTLSTGGTPSQRPLLAEAGVTLLEEPIAPEHVDPAFRDMPIRHIRAEDGTAIIIRAKENDRASPPVLTRRDVGEGQVWYWAAKVGALAYEERQLPSRYAQGGDYTPPEQPHMLDTMASIASLALGTEPGFGIGAPSSRGPAGGPLVLEAPRGLLAWVYGTERDGRSARCVHLLNCTGRDYQEGHPVEFDHERPPPMPPLPELVTRLPGGVSEALLASPELDEPVHLHLEAEDSASLVTIPADSFLSYGVIWAYE